MSYDLTNTDATIHGRFWFPDNPEKIYEGYISLVTGQYAILNLHTYETNGLIELGSESHKPLFRNRKIIHGVNDHGDDLTLYRCYANTSGTLLMAKVQYECQTLFEGVKQAYDELSFNGIDMHFDFQETWVAKTAFTTYHETRNDKKDLAKVTIPFCEKKSIDLNISKYAASEIYCGYSSSRSYDSLTFKHRSSINISFESAKSVEDIFNLVRQWEWILSLLTRKTVRIKTLDLKLDNHHYLGSDEVLKPIKFWKRREINNLQKKEPNQHDLYCTFSDIESEFTQIFNNWLDIQSSWEAVLHRFFATTQPRDIWVNEEFLFLAQAIESIHRIRTGAAGTVDFNKAAKEVYLAAPTDLKSEIGHRQTFQKQLHLSRNYYTHYGSPNPQECEHILEGTNLADLNEKLRWIIESAIMIEIGIPDNIISKIWSHQWRGHWVTYKD